MNIKSYYPEEVVYLENINIFVGPNSGGKSNLFEAIQGAINNVVFKHITIPQNPNWKTTNHTDGEKPFILNIDSQDQNYLINSIFDRHFMHLADPATFRMVFVITEQDIKLIETIISKSRQIKKVLNSSVANSQEIIDLLDRFPVNEEFKEFAERELIIDIYPHINPSAANIADFTAYTPEEHSKLQYLFEFLQYSNVFHELSLIVPNIEAYPVVRYFGPHRSLSQPKSTQSVDLSSIGNYEDNYSKGTNQNKDNSPSYIDGSFNKLCYLFKSRKYDLVKMYKKYLEKYLGIDFEIKRVREYSTKYVYNIKFTRKSGIPMKLSSGEKEFFNLITGLILTGIKNGIVLIDEPELHLHFQWQQIILDLVEQLSIDFNIQFLIITHSPKFINQNTLPFVHRIYMDNNLLTSRVIKPKNPVASNNLKDIVQFINTTNNEKAFFAQKVVLVEGISDLIVYNEIINKLKSSEGSDKEIEVIEVGSKHNLIRFRRLLAQWNIDNYIIGDLDYIKELHKRNENIISKDMLINRIKALDQEINTLIIFCKKKLKKILCEKIGIDSDSFISLLLQKDKISVEEFHQKIDELTEYILKNRATKIVSDVKLSKKLDKLLDDIAIEERILIIKNGGLEQIFPALNVSAENKVENALEVSKNIKIDHLPDYLKSYFLNIVK